MWGGVIVYNILAASVFYKVGYVLAANLLSIVNGACLLKILECADILAHLKKNKYLSEYIIKCKETCNFSTKAIETILIGGILIFVVIVSFSPLRVFFQWILILFFTFSSWFFNIMYKYFE
jgi:hypothetical protein